MVTHGGGGRVAARRSRSSHRLPRPGKQDGPTTISLTGTRDRQARGHLATKGLLPDVYVVGTAAAAVRSVALVVLLLRRERVTLLRRGTVRLPGLPVAAHAAACAPVACAQQTISSAKYILGYVLHHNKCQRHILWLQAQFGLENVRYTRSLI